MWLGVVGCMLGAGLVFFGWRGLLGVSTTALGALVTHVLISGGLKRWHGAGGVADPNIHVLIQGLLLGLVMPVMDRPLVPLMAGVLLGVVLRFVGRTRRVRAHPVAVVFVAVWLLVGFLRGGGGLGAEPFGAVEAVLRPHRVVVGDVHDVGDMGGAQSWLHDSGLSKSDAVPRQDPCRMLLDQQERALVDRSVIPEMLSSYRLCSLGEVIVGAVPGPIGAGSRGLLIVLGMMLMYKRLSWWPGAVMAILVAALTLLVMPVVGVGGLSVVSARLVDMGPAIGVTYTAYILLGSPLLLVVMILAPQSAPTSVEGRLAYAVLLGSGVIVLLWVLGPALSGMVSMLIASLLSRPLDALHKSPFLRESGGRGPGSVVQSP